MNKNPLADGQARIKHQRLFLNELVAEGDARKGIHPAEKYWHVTWLTEDEF